MTLRGLWTSVIEYETPRLVKIHNRKLGLVRRLIQLAIISYVGIYALWLQRGYQEFSSVESSVTIKIKGVTKSYLDRGSSENQALYTRVWDVADYVVPPAENGAFFVATNVIITPNQTRGRCPEDFHDIGDVICQPSVDDCIVDEEDFGQWRHPYSNIPSTTLQPESTTSLSTENEFSPFDNATLREQEELLFNASQGINTKVKTGALKCRSPDCPLNDVVFKAHGPLTGFCVPTDRPHSRPGVHTCEVETWCPIEIDKLPLGNKRALMGRAEDYTVFVKNSIAFPYFGSKFVRNNLVGNNGEPCLFKQNMTTGENNGCQIFKLGEMVAYAGGNFSQTAIKGGVVSMSISWHCNLDMDFMSTCLPKYSFRILDDFGWNFREAKYHEENRRTLFKMYGIKFILTVEGRGGKFNLKNTILNVGSGLALLGVSTVICDFLLMYIKEKGVVKQKKYDYINVSKRKKVQDDKNLQNLKNGLTHSMSTDTNHEPVTRTTTHSHLGRVESEPLPRPLNYSVDSPATTIDRDNLVSTNESGSGQACNLSRH